MSGPVVGRWGAGRGTAPGEEEGEQHSSHHKPVPRPLRRCWNSERKPEPERKFNQEKEDTEFSGKAFGRSEEARPTQAKLSSVLSHVCSHSSS